MSSPNANEFGRGSFHEDSPESSSQFFDQSPHDVHDVDDDNGNRSGSTRSVGFARSLGYLDFLGPSVQPSIYHPPSPAASKLQVSILVPERNDDFFHPPSIETSRLFLNSTVDQDVHGLHEIICTQLPRHVVFNLYPMALITVNPSMDDEMEIQQRFLSTGLEEEIQKRIFGIYLKTSEGEQGNLIGYLSFMVIEGNIPFLAFFVEDSHSHQGYLEEALRAAIEDWKTLPLKAVESWVPPRCFSSRPVEGRTFSVYTLPGISRNFENLMHRIGFQDCGVEIDVEEDMETRCWIYNW